ncbi:MAG: class I SAM-dependent methyltransferase [Solirubrobacteraceae bacterium]
MGERDADLARGHVSIVQRYRSSGRVIDVGAARGAFLREAGAHGFSHLAAVERDPLCCEALRAAGVDVAETDDPIAGLRLLAPADVVTIFHVIEHVPDPLGLLDAAAERLAPGGVVVIAAPNPESLSFRVCGRWWLHVDAPRHLHLLPLAVLRARAERNGLELVGVTTNDPVGMICNSCAWIPWADRVTRPLGPRAGTLLRALADGSSRAIQRRGMHGSTFTAIFRRP